MGSPLPCSFIPELPDGVVQINLSESRLLSTNLLSIIQWDSVGNTHRELLLHSKVQGCLEETTLMVGNAS